MAGVMQFVMQPRIQEEAETGGGTDAIIVIPPLFQP
jgi:hypothetical protein